MNQREPDFRGSSSPWEIQDLGNGKAVFFAGPRSIGEQVWVTDGSATGTKLLSLFGNPSEPPEIIRHGDSGGRLFWVSRSAGEECPGVPRLMRTDGTRAGTLVLTGCDQAPIRTTVLADRQLIFISDSWPHGGQPKLWMVSGDDNSPRQLADFASLDLSRLFPLRETALFTVRDGRSSSVELWRTDGTPGGTFRVANLPGTFATGASSRDRLYLLLAVNRLETEVWMSDGTAAGTLRMPPPLSNELSSYGGYLVPADGKVYFIGTTSKEGRELWVADGTAKGTRAITAFPGDIPLDLKRNQSNLNRQRLEVFPLPGRVLFVTYTPEEGREMWATDGNPASTAPLPDACPGACDGVHRDILPITLSERLLWLSGGSGPKNAVKSSSSIQHIWTSDGTPRGTKLVSGACPPAGCTEITDLFLSNGQGFFVSWEVGRDHALWTTDGFSARRLTNFTRSGGIMPLKHPYRATAGVGGTYFGRLGKLLLFRAYDALHGFELWKSDGTPGAETLVTDIENSPSGGEPHELAALDDSLVFKACVDGREELRRTPGTGNPTSSLKPSNTLGPCEVRRSGTGISSGGLGYFVYDATASAGPSLWRTDGTPAGTFRLNDSHGRPAPVSFFSSFVDVHSTLFWNAGLSGEQIWMSDGTADGTQLAVDLSQLGPRPEATQLAWAFEDHAYFSTGTTFKRKLWRTDGTPAGTQPVLDDNSIGAVGSGVELGGELYFLALSASKQSVQLWKTDGSSTGIAMLREHGFGPKSLEQLSLVTFRGHLYYFADELSGDTELWKSDGSVAGSEVLGVFDDINLPSSAMKLVVAGNRLFFIGEDYANGKELWSTQGSIESTSLVRDINPGRSDSDIVELVAAGDRVYFVADDGRHGQELWVSDGTPVGTRLVQDIASGQASSAPRYLTVVGNRLFFSADDGVRGRELWTVDFD